MRVEYEDHFGSDLMVANAARRSFGSDYKEWSDTPRTARGRSDRELVVDLAKEGHLLPFRHPKVMLSCDAPIPVARQLGKHQVGFEWSEISRRYKTKGIEFYRIGHSWRTDVKDRRQGSGELLPLDVQSKLYEIEERNISNAINDYEQALSLGAAPEQCRFLLPQSMEVFWTWTGSLLAWAHLYKQRTHKDTQEETRQFAIEAGNIINELFPVAWPAITNKQEFYLTEN